MKITAIWAREILDSRGNPTVEVEVFTDDGFGSAAAPSGASTGKYEAFELRDNEPRYLGKGVLKAVDNVNTIIAPALIGMDITNQQELDKKMIQLDGTPNKSKLGANAIVATSMALLRAASASNKKLLHDYLGGKMLPHAMFNIINGGKHAGGKLAIQEFMIIPDNDSFSERLAMSSEIYHLLGKQLVKNYGVSARNVGDEGGYAPPIDNTYKALDSLVAAVEEAGYSKECSFAMDAAASSFFSNNRYSIDSKQLRDSELVDFYVDLAKAYPIKSIEDPFDEENFAAFAALVKSLPGVQIVGDDLVVTNPIRIKKAIEENAMTALLLKVNQIGTVSEALNAAKMCTNNRINVVVSHRSGETEDCFISDFSVGINASYIKAGAPARGERTAKYNQLLRIEEQLTMQALAQNDQSNDDV